MPKYDYTKLFIQNANSGKYFTISSGIYRDVSAIERHPASFVRIKADSHDQAVLKSTMELLVDCLNTGTITEKFFEKKTYWNHNILDKLLQEP